MAERVPPFDSDTERACIGCAILDPRTLPLMRSIIEPRHFYAEKNRILWEALCSMADRGDPIDLRLIVTELTRVGKLERLGGAAKAISGLTDTVSTTVHSEAYAKHVVELADVRQMIYAAQEIAAHGYAGPDDVEGYIAESRSAIMAATAGANWGGGATGAAELARMAYEDAISKEEPKDLIPAGIGDVLLPRKIVSCIAGRPSNGKSTAALCVGANVALQNYNVLHFSIEDSEMTASRRLLSRFSGIPATRLRKRQVADNEHGALAEGASKISRLPFWICERTGVSMKWIRQFSAAHKARYGLDLVTIDYIQLVQLILSFKNATRNDVVGAIVREFLELARELDVAALMISQLSRPAKGAQVDPPTLQMLRDSGELEQIAKVVVFVHWPYFYDQQLDPNKLRWHLAKNSEGPTSINEAACDFQRMWIGDSSVSQYAANRDYYDPSNY